MLVSVPPPSTFFLVLNPWRSFQLQALNSEQLCYWKVSYSPRDHHPSDFSQGRRSQVLSVLQLTSRGWWPDHTPKERSCQVPTIRKSVPYMPTTNEIQLPIAQRPPISCLYLLRAYRWSPIESKRIYLSSEPDRQMWYFASFLRSLSLLSHSGDWISCRSSICNWQHPIPFTRNKWQPHSCNFTYFCFDQCKFM